MRSISANRSLVLAFLVVCRPALAAGVQKWTDAHGEVHYGDAPPPGANTQSVRVNAPPPSRNPAPVYSQPPAAAQQPAPLRGIDAERQARVDEVDKRNRDGMAGLAAAQARTQALNDKALIDQCKDAAQQLLQPGRQHHPAEELRARTDAGRRQQGAAMAQGRVDTARPAHPAHGSLSVAADLHRQEEIAQHLAPRVRAGALADCFELSRRDGAHFGRMNSVR